ncbi:MAG TPA: hypothetical protein VJ787_00700, partial [Thermoleophilia bacterium]|nr:hypothetical protein [Thermoleophilia bacterium]
KICSLAIPSLESTDGERMTEVVDARAMLAPPVRDPGHTEQAPEDEIRARDVIGATMWRREEESVGPSRAHLRLVLLETSAER